MALVATSTALWKAKGHIRSPQIVVNCFGQGDHIESFGPQEIGGFVGSVAAQDDPGNPAAACSTSVSWQPPCPPLSAPGSWMVLKGGATAAQGMCRLGENSEKSS